MKLARRIASALLLTALACSPVSAKGLVVYDLNNLSGSMPTEGAYHKRYISAVKRMLDKWGADYKVLPPQAVLTEFARTGVVYYQRSGTYGYVTTGPSETFSWVIHLGFNGTSATYVSTYRPDSLTLTAKLPTVPQLFLVDDTGNGSFFATFMDNATNDSTWVVPTVGFQGPGGGSGNHEGEGTLWTPEKPQTMFDSIFGNSIILKSGSPNGGLRKLLCVGANAVIANLELTGNMPLYPDSTTGGASDTVKVWEKLNLHKSGSARIVFASCFGPLPQDSIAIISATDYNYEYAGVNWPVLGFSIAHLDSLASGDIIRRVPRWTAVIHSVGGTSDRRHPGGMFAADSLIRKASADSLAQTGVRLTLAALPESLAVNPSIAVAWKRAGQVRFAPFVRLGLDTLGVCDNATTTRPVDVWGRYRNRYVYDAAESDTSLFTLYRYAKSNLASVVGYGYLSNALIPPDGDWSPYQLRRGNNYLTADSIAWLAAKLGAPIIQNGYGREMDPTYLTNPLGFARKEGRYSVQAASLRGQRATFLSFAYAPTRGSRLGNNTDGLSFLGELSDSIPPTCVPGPCGGPNASTVYESIFWNGFFGPDREYTMLSYDGASTNKDGVYSTPRLYDFGPASVVYLPEQAFGGQCLCGPNRWGFFVIKHLMAATQLMNYAAGRTVFENAWPEDVQP